MRHFETFILSGAMTAGAVSIVMLTSALIGLAGQSHRINDRLPANTKVGHAGGTAVALSYNCSAVQRISGGQYANHQ